MGKLNVPPTADPASNVRKGPAGPSGPGAESKADMGGAMDSAIGPGAKRNSGGENLGFNSSAIHAALK